MGQKYDVTLAHAVTGELKKWSGVADDEAHAVDLAHEEHGGAYVAKDVELVAPRYPDVEVELDQDNGNAFLMISRVRSALRLARVSKDEIDEFTKEAMSADLDVTVRVITEWITVK